MCNTEEHWHQIKYTFKFWPDISIKSYINWHIHTNWHKVHGLTHWGPMMHMCISESGILGSNDSLSPIWHQAITQTNDNLFVNWTHRNRFSEVTINIRKCIWNFGCKLSAILLTGQCDHDITPNIIRPQWVKRHIHQMQYHIFHPH